MTNEYNPDGKEIRFIDSHYKDLFHIPDGSCVQIHYPDEMVVKPCTFIDEYHTQIGYNVFHICQFAEIMERNGASYMPEPEIMGDEAAWKVGKDRILAVQTCEDGYDYTLLDENYNEIDGGQVDNPELSMLEVRRDILESFGLERRELRAMFYEDVMEQAFEVGRQAVVVNDPIAELAFKLDRFAENFDPYEYMDQVDDVQAHIQEIKADLAAGNTAPYREFLNDDVKTKLIANGVPAEEVAFIHDADTEAKKKDLFAKVRTGQVRVLLGSTQKMGAGTNVQDKLVAVHHLDVGWRPSDMTQRNGRIIRQGNRNKEVQVYQYVTEGTFDAYLYQTLENKQKFISQIMTSKSPVRSCDDVDEQALSYAEIKALCAGNPLIKEKMDLDIDVARLKVLKADHQSQQYRMEDKLLKYFPAEIEKQTGYIHGFEADIKTVEAHPQIADGFCGMEIMGKAYTEKADAGEILLAACKDTKSADPVPLGSYRGFQMELSFDSFRNEFDVTLKGAVSHRVALGTDARGNITRLDNALAGILERLERANEQLNNLYNQQEAAKAEVGKPFPQEAELTAKSQRLAELDAALNMEDSVENRDERSESERPSVLADLKSKAEHIPPAKYSETREEVL